MPRKVRGISTNIASLLCTLYLFKTCSAINDDIDKDHHAMFPYCGTISQGTDQKKARAINAKDSTDEYRWSVYLLRDNTEPKSGNTRTSECSRTIISDR